MQDQNPEQLKKEFLKCKTDPIHFISNYIKVVHPKRGLVNFNLYPFQKQILSEFKDHRFNILRKFRQAGCTTLVAAYCLYLCIFQPYTTIAILSKGQDESAEVISRIKTMYDELPVWLKPPVKKDNEHTFALANRSVIRSKASGKQSGRSLAGSLLVLDEAAFIENIDTIWAAVYPIISTGGSVIALSTVNGVGNWFHRMYTEAIRKENDFNAIDINWKDHPEYRRHLGYDWLYDKMASYTPPVNIDDWERITKKNLTLKEWLQEYECEFLGTGDTFIDGDILRQLKESCNKEFYNKYNLRMRVWEEPKPYYEYVMGIDCGLGRNRDYSAFHIINLYNGEQVAEFYSNRTPIDQFAEIINTEAKYYNTAYILPERNSIGNNLIYFLHQVHEYENMLMDQNRDLGIQITQKNRDMLLSDMEDDIRNGKIKLNSERTIDELLTFVIDPDTGKVSADSNCHDDLIVSLSLTCRAFREIRETTPIENYKPLEELDNKFKLPPIAKAKYISRGKDPETDEEIRKWILGKG